MHAELQTITQANFDAVIHQHPLEKDYSPSAHNAFAVAEASAHPTLHARAVYLDEQLCGFVLFDGPHIHRMTYADNADPYTTLGAVLNYLITHEGYSEVFVAVPESNGPLALFYKSMGFEETQHTEKMQRIYRFSLDTIVTYA